VVSLSNHERVDVRYLIRFASTGTGRTAGDFSGYGIQENALIINSAALYTMHVFSTNIPSDLR
jgi:hypothetical protein